MLPMARPRSENPKTVSVTVKMSEKDLAVLDERRKGVGRSAYLRWLLVNRPITGTHPHPDPVVPPVDPTSPPQPPIPSPVSPPVPPPTPVETHLHQWKKIGAIFQECSVCGERARR